MSPPKSSITEPRLGSKICLKNVAYDLLQSPTKLSAKFSSYGAIVAANVPLNRDTGRPRGYAFITFENPASAEAAIRDLNGKEVSGRTIELSYASTSKQSFLGSPRNPP